MPDDKVRVWVEDSGTRHLVKIDFGGPLSWFSSSYLVALRPENAQVLAELLKEKASEAFLKDRARAL